MPMYETPKIDVHGMNSEDACNIVRANLVAFKERGYSEVFIVHGKGQGILRKKIREMLKYFAFVKKIRSGKYNEGGEGVSVVYF
jgi:DNA mismatch repair protein MutS2